MQQHVTRVEKDSQKGLLKTHKSLKNVTKE